MNRPGLKRVLSLVTTGKVQAVIIAKLDRLTRSVKDLCTLLELFEKSGVGLISVAESLDTGSAAGRLVITIMGAVSQWEREAIGERTREALRHKRSKGQRVGNIAYGFHLAGDGVHVEADPTEQAVLSAIRNLRRGGQKAAQKNLRAHFLFCARSAKNQYLLRGMIKCARCGPTYVGAVSNRRNGKVEFRYTCNGAHSSGIYRPGGRCQSKSIRGTIWSSRCGRTSRRSCGTRCQYWNNSTLDCKPT